MPPNIGEPAKNAIVIIVPRTIPTITNRFIEYSTKIEGNADV